MREAQAAVKLKSEFVARVTDVGRSPTNVPYMVMEYLQGQDLGIDHRLLADRQGAGLRVQEPHPDRRRDPAEDDLRRMEAALDPRLEDRSLTDDVERAAKMLDELA